MAKKSPRFSIDKIGMKKVGKGTLIAGIGAALVFLVENVGSIDFGEYSPFVVAIAAVLVNVARKFLLKY